MNTKEAKEKLTVSQAKFDAARIARETAEMEESQAHAEYDETFENYQEACFEAFLCKV